MSDARRQSALFLSVILALLGCSEEPSTDRGPGADTGPATEAGPATDAAITDSLVKGDVLDDGAMIDAEPPEPAPAEVTFELTVLDPNASGLFAVADIDGDGKNDLVVAQADDPPLHWRSYPDLQIHPITDQGAYSMEVHAADIDGDGDADVIAPQPDPRSLVWFENPRPQGDPTTAQWPRHDVGTWPAGGEPHDFKIGDLNGDGRIDAVICPNVKSPFYVFIQPKDSAASWNAVVVDGAAGVEGTWLGDIDSDGDDDIIDGEVWIESPADPLDAAGWLVHPIHPYPHDKKRVAAGDIDGDGRLDVIVADAEFGAGPLVWYQAPADPRQGSWTPHELMPAADHNFHTLQLGDINGDGHLDILFGSTHYLGDQGGYQVRVLYNNQGDAEHWHEQSWTTKHGIWQGVLADVGSDGDLDLVTANYKEGIAQQELWENLLVP